MCTFTILVVCLLVIGCCSNKGKEYRLALLRELENAENSDELWKIGERLDIPFLLERMEDASDKLRYNIFDILRIKCGKALMEQKHILWQLLKSEHFEARYYALLLIALQRYDTSDEVRKKIQECMSDDNPLIKATAKLVYVLWDFTRLFSVVDEMRDEMGYLTPDLYTALNDLQRAFKHKVVSRSWPPTSDQTEKNKRIQKAETIFRQCLGAYLFEWEREADDVLAQYKSLHKEQKNKHNTLKDSQQDKDRR